jgi:hypothetical protein
MGAAVGYVGVYPATVRAAEAQGVDLMERLRASLNNAVEADGDLPEGALNGITVWHAINGRRDPSGAQETGTLFTACPNCTMPCARAAQTCDYCGAERC